MKWVMSQKKLNMRVNGVRNNNMDAHNLTSSRLVRGWVAGARKGHGRARRGRGHPGAKEIDHAPQYRLVPHLFPSVSSRIMPRALHQQHDAIAI